MPPASITWSARAWQEEKPALGDDVAKRHPELFCIPGASQP